MDWVLLGFLIIIPSFGASIALKAKLPPSSYTIAYSRIFIARCYAILKSLVSNPLLTHLPLDINPTQSVEWKESFHQLISTWNDHIPRWADATFEGYCREVLNQRSKSMAVAAPPESTLPPIHMSSSNMGGITDRMAATALDSPDDDCNESMDMFEDIFMKANEIVKEDEMKQYSENNTAASRVQSAFRGYFVRRSLKVRIDRM